MSDLDTLVSLVEAAGALRVYKAGEVPGDPGDAYVVLSLTPGSAVNRRTSGHGSRQVRECVVQCFGATHDAASAMAGYADAALNERTLTALPGAPFSVRVLSAGPMRDPDGETRMYVLHTYRL